MKNKIIFFTFFACQSVDSNLSTNELYSRTQEAIKRKNHKTAAQYLEVLKDREDFQLSSTDLLWMEGNISFGQKEYAEAIYSYQLFLDLYPRHPKREEVEWGVVLSYRKLVGSSFDRDITYCPTLVKVAAPFAFKKEEAKDYIKHCHALMAEKELATAELYFRTKKKTAAMERLTYFFETFEGVHLPDKLMKRALDRKKEWTKK